MNRVFLKNAHFGVLAPTQQVDKQVIKICMSFGVAASAYSRGSKIQVKLFKTPGIWD
jgi:hypothetical protein